MQTRLIKCPNCNELRTFKQLHRVEDFDGDDVLYECPVCGHKISTRE